MEQEHLGGHSPFKPDTDTQREHGRSPRLTSNFPLSQKLLSITTVIVSNKRQESSITAINVKNSAKHIPGKRSCKLLCHNHLPPICPLPTLPPRCAIQNWGQAGKIIKIHLLIAAYVKVSSPVWRETRNYTHCISKVFD